MNAKRITPSSPIMRPIGSSHPDAMSRTLVPPMYVFATTHVTAPAGSATITALFRTNSVRSSRDRTIILPSCGFLYGGSSRVNAEGTPFKMVLESASEIKSVTRIPMITSPTTVAEAMRLLRLALIPPTNVAASAISAGNLPLHGTKLFVRIAIRRSLGDSITRAAMTPAALQPKPMLIVSACLP